MPSLSEQVERCVAKLREGTLMETDLRDLLSADSPGGAGGSSKRQSILYIQASSSHPWSPVIGMSIFEGGKDADGVDEKGEFLYKSIYQALSDGWRIVKFPEMTLAMDEQNTYALGYEFILERWR